MPVLRLGHNCSAIASIEEAAAIVDAHLYYRAVHRAVASARHYVLLSGWQLTSDVALLRGDDAVGIEAPADLLGLLEWACERTPDLQVYLLAWDFSAVFALEREWFQEQRLTSRYGSQIHFSWDAFLPTAASHHQKLVVVDGTYAFAGGMDLCASRWDTREHAADHPLRQRKGKPRKPYHDVQAFVRGAAVSELQSLFCLRWLENTGERLVLRPAERTGPAIAELCGGEEIVLAASEVAISETRIPPDGHASEPVRHIRQLYLDAIASAERLIYIENQYFTSRSLTRAIAARLEARDRGRLCVVVVMPQGGDTPKEKLALGEAQTFCLLAIQRAAREGGHDFRAFYTGPRDDRGKVKPTFIHSKLMVVDDRFLTIGSANATNRSFGLDSELNLTWEGDDDALVHSIATLRASLLAEHCGSRDPEPWRALPALAKRLDAAARSSGRLHARVLDEADDHDPVLSLATDPTGPVDDELLDDRLDEAWETFDRGWFWSGLERLAARFGKADARSDEE